MRKSLFTLWKIIKFLRDNDVKTGQKLLFLVPFLYLIMPFDVVGDFFPVAGQLDDVAVFVLMWPILKSLISGYEPGEGSGNDSRDEDTVDMDRGDYEIE
ncbi:YkvA family protein [Halothermothrix orenii]|uniref:DUF1232 domain-containing protein n=1 Tax=Halothermothrix orenii (strain H 168 / OCM 544 / DSM 9562) TaxID=373903 RepID=B8D0N4_HALOH|nr:YkvA family protein [Halothermothrix orenii]ACL70970.1 Protein of unknown function (DUF1232) [Halothermothrix orenii H 168]